MRNALLATMMAGALGLLCLAPMEARAQRRLPFGYYSGSPYNGWTFSYPSVGFYNYYPNGYSYWYNYGYTYNPGYYGYYSGYYPGYTSYYYPPTSYSYPGYYYPTYSYYYWR